jgi:hypothetical protein
MAILGLMVSVKPYWGVLEKLRQSPIKGLPADDDSKKNKVKSFVEESEPVPSPTRRLANKIKSIKLVPAPLRSPRKTLVQQCKRAWTNLNVCFLVAFLFYILVFFWLCNLPLEKGLLRGVFVRFFIQPNILIYLWMGVALGYLKDLFSSTGKGNYFYMENFELTVAYYTDSS